MPEPLEDYAVSPWPMARISQADKTRSHAFLRYRRKRDTPTKTDNQALYDRLMAIQNLLYRRAEPAAGPHNMSADSLLDRVLQVIRSIGPPKNGLLPGECKMSGDWVADAAGGLFRLIKTDSGEEAKIERKPPHDRVHVGFMNYKDWNTTVRFPYGNSSQYIIINAWNHRDKLVATFMGECRVCRNREVLSGNWAVVSHSRDCESVGTTGKLIGEVFRRDNIEALRKGHINKQKIKGKKAKPSQIEQPPEEVLSTTSTATIIPKHEKKTTPGALHIKLH